jgi:hypothetical protein
MTITVKHSKVSAVSDGVDTTVVRPSDWNADHSLVGTVPIANGGTGAATANDAFNALAPSQAAASGKYLTTDGTNTSWGTNPLGTVTSVAATVPSVLSISGSPITTSGTLAITYSGTALPVLNGGTGVTTSTGTTNVVLSGSPTIVTPVIAQINDANGNEMLSFVPVTSATDYFVIKNGIGVGAPLHIYADGTSSNTGIHIQPKGTGLVTISDGTDFNKGIRFRSSSSAASAITLLDAVSTAGRVVTLPDATTTLVGRDTTDTLTNKSISGSTNTLSNIGNSSLTNSAITINGTSTSLGGSISVGTVTSVTGTSPVVSSGGATPAISMPAATTSVDGYLTSTDWTTFNNKSNTNGTVTSVAALTLGTTGTDLSSTVATGTTTPVITLQVPTASATNRGALSAADWITFNNKGSGTVTSVTGTAPVVSSGGVTPAISMAAATTSVDGYLTATDWNTFNGKQAAFGSQTANYFYAAPNGSAGSPTFRAVVAADIPTLNQNTSGNAGTVTNGVYTTGSYADPTWITSLAGSKITGTISGGTF